MRYLAIKWTSRDSQAAFYINEHGGWTADVIKHPNAVDQAAHFSSIRTLLHFVQTAMKNGGHFQDRGTYAIVALSEETIVKEDVVAV